MKTRTMFRTGVLLIGAGFTLTTSTDVALAAGPDFKATAQTLVGQSANVKEGELVLITGTPRDTELLEHIAILVFPGLRLRMKRTTHPPHVR
jgi:hypothetical protein